MQELKQSTQIKVRVGPFIDVTDGFTPETGITLGAADEAELLKQNGAATVSIAANTWAAVTSCDGWYDLTLTTTDTNTLGQCTIVIQDDSVCLPVFVHFMIVSANFWDSKFGAEHLDVNVVEVDDDTTAADNLELMFDGTGYAGGTTKLDVNVASEDNIDFGATRKASINTECDTALSDYDPPTRAELTTDKNSIITEVDANETKIDTIDGIVDSILVDTGTTLETHLTDIKGGTFSGATDSLEVIRDRGDAAWTTGGGGAITQLMNPTPIIPLSIDLANTATVRLGIALINSMDDLPGTAEITPGTITIDRKAIGDTSWSNIVNAAACSEVAGLVYYDEVFDSGTGYAEADSLRITFKSIKITVDANDHEIIGTDGWIFYTSIRQTMVGTDNAATATALTTHDGKLDTVDANVDAILIDTGTTLDGKIDTIDTNVDAILVDTGTTLDTNISTLLTRLSAVRAGYLDELAAANLPADIDAILTDTGTTLDGKITTIDTVVDAIKVITDALPNSGALTTIDANIDSILADTGTTLDGKITTIDTVVDAIKVITDALPNSGALTTIDANIDSILADTGTDGVVLTAAAIDAILDEVVEGTLTLRQAIRLFLSALSGKSSGGGTVTLTFRDNADSKNRITATVDANGNRTAMTLDGT